MNYTRDELAQALRTGHRSIILEADEWRPLADHVMGLISSEISTLRLRITELEATLSATQRALDERMGPRLTPAELEVINSAIELVGYNHDVPGRVAYAVIGLLKERKDHG